MRRGKIFFGLVTVIIVSSFFVIKNVLADNADIVINEIGAYPTTKHEWIEIWNKGLTPVDLSSWKFLEGGSRHSLVNKAPDNILGSNEYAVFTQDDVQFLMDYPGFSGKIFDSSWGSLDLNGESLGLEDSLGNVVEQFTYLHAPNFSLERINPFLKDYSASNWKEHVSGNTVGFQNSIFSTSGSPVDAVPTSTPTSTPPTPTSTAENSDLIWSQIKINEVVPDPETGDEWVELFNPTTSSLDLAGGFLCDSRTAGTCTIAAVVGIIPAQGWLVVNISGSKLNNSGDSVILKNASTTVIDYINYVGALLPKKGQAIARKIDGADTDNDSDWTVTTSLTPNNANSIVAPPVPVSSAGGSGGVYYSSGGSSTSATKNNSTPTTSLVYATSTSPIIINEIFPDPVGADQEGEFVELKNISSSTVDLAGWKIKNNTKTYSLNGELEPEEILVLSRPTTGIALKNSSKEDLFLLDTSGVVRDVAVYEKAFEGQSLSRTKTKGWQWSEEETRGKENVFKNETENSPIKKQSNTDVGSVVWNLELPRYAVPEALLNFSAAKSVDRRGGRLSFRWSFGDGTEDFGEKVSHIYATSGMFSGLVEATSGSGSVEAKKFEVAVSLGGAGGPSSIEISEVFPNPAGADTAEFVELYNSGIDPVDLGGWKLVNKNDDYFLFPSSTIIFPEEYRVFFRAGTNLNLANTNEVLELKDARGNTIEKVGYAKSENGKSLSANNVGQRVWSTPSPWLATPVDPISTKITAKKAKSVAKKSASTSATKKVSRPTIFLNDLSEVQEMEKGNPVTLEGVVTAVPGVFGSQYFYVSDENGGVQVYQSKKDFPDLQNGMWLKVSGTVSTLKNGSNRINIKSRNDVKIVNNGEEILLEVVAISDLEKEDRGKLVSVEGEITERKSSFMYLDDGHDEIAVYFKKGAKIKFAELKEGSRVKVVGVVEEGTNGLEVWPRSTSDIEMMGTGKELTNNQSVVEVSKNEAGYWQRYEVVAVVGIMGVLFLFFIRARGNQTAVVLKSIINRGKDYFNKKG